MDYRVVMIERAEEDLGRCMGYLLFEKKNKQAARNLLDGFEKTKASLSIVAGS